MLDKTEGIVIKTVKYAETSIIAKIFTKKYGLLSFMVKGVRNSKNKQKGNLIQPLNMLNLEVYVKEQKQLHHIREYNTNYIYKTLHADFSRQSIALFCIELISKCIKEHEINERLYNYFTLFLTELDQTHESVENKPLFFLLETASILGFEPSLHHILEGRFFNLESGKFEDTRISATHSLDEHETLMLKKMIAMYYEKNVLKLSSPERKILLEKLLLYFKWHVADFTDMKSPDILSEVLR